ncbi:MAG: hypothetical protein ACXVQJ_05145, partial [Actinomycetota bacterium]
MEPRGTRASLATAGAVALSLVGWLALPPPASAQTAQPWIQAELTVQQVCVFDVPQADVLIDNQPAGTVGTGHPCLNLNPNGDDPPPFSLVPGTTIQAAGRELVVADVGITYADAATDAAWGWIQQGATVDVQFYDEAWMDPPEDTQTIVDEGDGRWSTTTSVDLLDDQGQVNAVVRDGDGDATYASREVRDPWIGANADEEHVILSSFPARAQADISVGGEQIGSLTLDGNGDAATEGDSLGGFDLRVGQTVAVTADGISDDLLLVDVTGRLDADADLIFGQAPPGSTVSAEIWDHTDWASTQASQNGAWSIDTFATWGYHLQRSDLGDLKVADDDGDSTMRNLPTPMAGFEVTFFQNTYGSDGWWGISGTSLPQNTPVAIDVAGTPFDCPNEGAVTDESGGFWCSDLPAPAVGQTVTVTAGELTRTLTVEALTMDVLHVGGYPSGTADPGTDLLVVRDWDDGNGAWVTSGPDGAWAA